MIAVIYVRVSTDEQIKHGYSLEGQQEACRERAKALGVLDILVFQDEGITGAILERPALQKALEACKNAECKYLIRRKGDFFILCEAHLLSMKKSLS